MLALIALLFIVLPLVEIYVIVQVGSAIGALNTIGLLLLVSLGGVWLAKHEGFWVLRRLRDQLDAGRMPTNELIDAGLVLVGAILLIFPGFVTDVLGLLLLFPPTRVVARTLVKRRFQFQVYGTAGPPARRDDRRPPPDDVIDV
jgi:UPF0716 protein FxsA